VISEKAFKLKLFIFKSENYKNVSPFKTLLRKSYGELLKWGENMKSLLKSVMLCFFVFAVISCGASSSPADSETISYRAVYTVDNSSSRELHITNLGSGQVESGTTRLTSGHYDMKPSWSKTGNMIVFFRYVSGDLSNIPGCLTKLCVINADGTNFRELTNATDGNFNPTWTRDGTNRIVFNRYNHTTSRWQAFITSPTASPGDELIVSRLDEAVHSCLSDGRLVTYVSGKLYLMTPNPGGTGVYQKVARVDDTQTWQHSFVSPDETMISFELDSDHNTSTYMDCSAWYARIDVTGLSSSAVIQAGSVVSSSVWEGYPRWTSDSRYIVYHSNASGTFQFYMYRVSDGTTRRVSADLSKSYLYACFENSPC
jgi:Tol biopolymer transport system component